MAYDIKFSEEKNQLLQVTRGISFENIIDALEKGKLLADTSHHSKKYPHQRIYVVEITKYAYAVPYVINHKKKEIFLKTIFASRVFTPKYINRKKNMKKLQDPFANQVLDEYEKELEESFERDEFKNREDFEDTKLMLQEAAQKYKELSKSRPITIRLNQLDLIKLKAKAKVNNIPYQTLLSMLVNSYVEGRHKIAI